MRKLFKTLIALGSVAVFLIGAVAIVGPMVDTAGYRYLVGGFALSYLTPTNQKVKNTKKKTGGIIHGVCHPNENDIELIKDANIDWVRFDLTSPVFDANNNLTPGYINFKNRCKVYADEGIKVMCVTPYPSAYMYSEYFGGHDSNVESEKVISSVDPRTQDGLNHIAKDAEFMINDLQGYVGAFQITNEMPVDRFRKPLTLEEASDYISVQLRAMYEKREENNNILIGYNVADFSMYQLFKLIDERGANKYCDYLGLDLYLGCFENTFKDLFWYDLILRGFYQQSKLPMIVNEFGYIGAGQPLTDEERIAFLQQFGYSSEQEASQHIIDLIENEKFNPVLRNRMYSEIPDKNPEQLADLLFNRSNTNCYAQHFYEEMTSGYQLNKYKHTREDQARFYDDVINKHFRKLDFLCGAIAYCWSDSSTCYICGSANCPIETGWGFKDLNGKLKPSYYTLKEAYANWR